MTFIKSTPLPDVTSPVCDTAASDLGGNPPPPSSTNGTGTTTGTANGATNCPQYYDNIARIVCLFWFNDITLLEACLKRPSSHNHTSTQMLSQLSNPTDSFRQFVSSVIEYTQLLPVAVSVSLLYILRLKQLSPKAIVGNPNSEYRVFTVGLMMANKFLDDNTYTNKTWAQVTKLPLAEVSTMEIEFLSNLGYNLRIAPQEWNSWSRDLKRWLSVHKQFCEGQTKQRKQYSPPPSFYSKFKWSGAAKAAPEYVEDTDTPSPSSITSLTPTYPSVSPQTPPMERKRQLDEYEDTHRHKRVNNSGNGNINGNNQSYQQPQQQQQQQQQPYAQQFPPIQPYMPMSVPSLPPQQQVPVLPLPYYSPNQHGALSTGHSPNPYNHVQPSLPQQLPQQPLMNVPNLHAPQHVQHVQHGTVPGSVPTMNGVPLSVSPSGLVVSPGGLSGPMGGHGHGHGGPMGPGGLGVSMGGPMGLHGPAVGPNGPPTGPPVAHPVAIPPPMPYLPLAPKSLTADKFLPHPPHQPPNQQPLYYVLSKSRDKQPLEGHIQQQYYGYPQPVPFGGSSPIGPQGGRWFCPTEPSSPYSPGAVYHYASPGKNRWR